MLHPVCSPLGNTAAILFLGQNDKLMHRLTPSGELRHPHASLTNYTWVISKIPRRASLESLSSDISLSDGVLGIALDWYRKSPGPSLLSQASTLPYAVPFDPQICIKDQQDGSLLRSTHQASPGTRQPMSTSTGDNSQAQIVQATMNTWGWGRMAHATRTFQLSHRREARINIWKAEMGMNVRVEG